MTEQEKQRFEEELKRNHPNADPKLAALGAFARATETVRQATAALKEGEGIAKLCNAAIAAHDENASALTEVRKLLRGLQPELLDGGKFSPARFQLVNDVIDMLNNRIIASRKLAKGELP